MGDQLFDPMARGERRLEAYYYTFAAPGWPAIDAILAAVAAAGKAYHNTSEWNEPGAGKAPDSESFVDAIQRLADKAAAEAERADALLREGLDLMERCQAIPTVGTTPTSGQTEEAINQWAEKVRRHIEEG